MYRTVLPLLLYMGGINAAPSDNSGITYVKIHPITTQDKAETPVAALRSSQYRESRIENVPLTIRGYKSDYENEPVNIRHVRSDNDEFTTPQDDTEETETTESAEVATEMSTERDLFDAKIDTGDYDVSERTPSPRFYSKLSYFQRPNFDNGVSTNLVETHPWRRKFRSKCRCERLSNCPKLQISIPRCPEEFFMCCF